jgi:membrane-associated protease RseP (regulator of RpoE activity)
VGLEFLVNFFLHPGPNDVVVFSPILYAAWFGFLITFLNLMPAWQLDGGHMAASVLNAKGRSLATMLSVFVLLLLQLYLMAFFIFFLSWGAREVRPLDDVSSVSKGRVLLFVAMMVLAGLTVGLFLFPPIY